MQAAPPLDQLRAVIAAICRNILQYTPEHLQSVAYRATYKHRDHALNLLRHNDVQFPSPLSLLNTIRAPKPPTIEFFKSLPLVPGKLWVVYVLVLEKPGMQPAIYVGKSTHSKGYSHRMSQYDKHRNLPRFVEMFFEKGYTITHRATLAWAAIPSDPLDRVRLTGLILLLETLFALLF